MINFKTLKKLSQHLCILYVEDDDILRTKTAHIFSNLFKQVDIAKDGHIGLHLYKEYHLNTNQYYDIVISDIQMPNLDGIGFSKAIFKINKNQKIIITSAYNDKEYLIELINIGVNGFMQKPLSSEKMLEVLLEVCISFQNKNFVHLGDEYYYDGAIKVFFKKNKKIVLSDSELKLLDLLVNNVTQSFSAQDIFNHIYYEQIEKEFSIDSIKSLIKRLRKKLPANLISNTPQLGYCLNLPQ